jgi:catechol 2,3-dioxygenase-like lactoylglutathione lyase family enzyme
MSPTDTTSGGSTKRGAAAAPIALRVKSLDHVTLVVKDLDRSHEFYAGGLGMQPIERPAFSFAGSWFQAGKTQIHLILEHPESGPAGVPIPQQLLGMSRTHHFAFEVDDAYAATEILRQKGIPVVSGPKNRPDGMIQVFATDPDGHVVELCSWPR